MIQGAQLASEMIHVRDVLEAAGADSSGELAATVITSGRSNITYKVSGTGGNWIVRTPPLHGKTPAAHDVSREYRVMRALQGTAVPVPKTVALCEDESRIGRPFSIVEFVPGIAVQTRRDLAALQPGVPNQISTSLSMTLAALHEVDFERIGLADYGRTTGHAERLLRRWGGQWEIVGLEEHAREAAQLVHQLRHRIPRQAKASLVHGDFRVDNVLLREASDPSVAAVLDWELSTIGDPMSDLATMCAYRNPAFDDIIGEPTAWASDLFPEPDTLINLYEAASGTSVVDFDFHYALACFKIATIAAGIAYRYAADPTEQERAPKPHRAVGPFLEAGLSAL